MLSPSSTNAITYSSVYVKLPQCELVMRDDVHSDSSCEGLSGSLSKPLDRNAIIFQCFKY